ncbi:Uncharacterised protein [uncultured Clostridium sp.]|uniref:hypothetical protein n=1 Tax=uncultured Clostridium sp. TaxID=59620 RepID=UPI000821AB1E|nr:hypothetical protein [uncultured Clostridium sp.]SCJ89647.1 Uncharacterised protein [uncultured Clostridium sp.]
MYSTLSYIGEKFNNSNILWAVGASILLNQYDLIETPNDIDIFVDVKDIDRADEILKSIGSKKLYEKTTTYSTKYFYEYVVNKIDIDVMAGFAVNYNNGVYRYIFDENSIGDYRIINNTKIPFTTLEDWYVIYQLIPKREAKVKMIEEYILNNGSKNRFLLERALYGNLPLSIRNKINNILDKIK